MTTPLEAPSTASVPRPRTTMQPRGRHARSAGTLVAQRRERQPPHRPYADHHAAGRRALVPDLATDTGRPSANNTIWEFTLQGGVKWADGSTVTCDDLKYGIERRYAKTIADAGGLPYPTRYLADNAPPYSGPYGMGQLNSRAEPDQALSTVGPDRRVGGQGQRRGGPDRLPHRTADDGYECAWRGHLGQLRRARPGHHRLGPA